ncbi:hypothetical protein [Tessaracoccus sp.]
MKASTTAWLRQRGWWISFVALLVIALVFSLAVGDYVAKLRQPVEAGRSTIGEWADLSEHGFRARLDDVSIATTFPSAYDPNQKIAGPDGTSLLRVRMSIEALVDANDIVGCSWRLFNGSGERLTLTEYGIEGPASTECTFISEEATREKGVPFQTQLVYVVVPEALESYSLQLSPSLAGDSSYWTFTP